jgi:hypothetical protein
MYISEHCIKNFTLHYIQENASSTPNPKICWQTLDFANLGS